MSAQPHKDRSHAVYSASATARNVVCYGAIAMSALCEDVEREAAAWGTTCHEAAERCFKEEKDAHEFIGQEFKVGKFTFTFDEEMANTTQTYVDYVRETSVGGKRPLWIEKNFSLASLNPPLEAGGTADAIIYNPDENLLEVADLKAGRGVTVDVVGNPQGRFYAIGAILSLPDVKPTHVRVTIVQPRVGDGKPKSDTFHVTELLDWSTDLLGHMAKSKEALDAFEALPPGNRLAFDDWAATWLTPGQCTFCTAKPICPALRKKALDAMPALARQWHEDPSLTTPPALSNLAKLGSAEELAHDLDGFDELEGWIKARRAYAHAQAEAGVTVPGYGLVDKIGNRAWSADDEAVAKELQRMQLSEAAVWTKKLASVAQIEKALGKRKAELAKLEGILWEKPRKGTNLVRLDKTERPAAKSLTERFNENVE